MNARSYDSKGMSSRMDPDIADNIDESGHRH
jgi:hypothetical protein